MQALASGQVQMAFDGLLTSRTLEKSGKARIIAVADDKRARAAPDVPTMAEAGAPGAYASGGYHFFGPANVPRPIIARLNTELIKVLRMQEINDMYTSTGMEVVASTPEEQVGILQSQSERLGSIIRKLGIKLD
jgi:tripartite-type tricarboxylate transporter receptor subunit TctC